MDWKRASRIGAVLLIIGVVVLIGLKQPSANSAAPTDPGSAQGVVVQASEKVSLRDVKKRISPPDFTLMTTEGAPFTLSSLKGKAPVIVTFFSTTCGGCNLESPHLEAIYKKYKDQGLKMVSISTEDPDTLRAFAKRKGTTFPLLTDSDGKVSRIYQAESVPMNFFIDSQGRACEISLGYDPENGPAHLAGLADALVRDMKLKT